MSRRREVTGDDKDDGILRDILGDARAGDDRRDDFDKRRPPARGDGYREYRVDDYRVDDYRVDDFRVDDFRSSRRYATEPIDYDLRPPYPEDHRGLRGSYSYNEFPRDDPYRRLEPEIRRPRYEYDDRRDSRSYEHYEAELERPPVVRKFGSFTKPVTRSGTASMPVTRSGGKRRFSEEGEVSGSASRPDITKKFSPIVFDLKAPERLRFFTARCNYYDMFAKSKKDSVWRAPQYVVKRISQVLQEDSECRVLLVFTVHGSQYWQGIAEVDRKRRIEFDVKLARVPLEWICLGDVSYMASPRIPDLFVEENAVKESFEIPEELGKEFFGLFDRFIADDPTRSLGNDKLKPFLKK